jgi:GT2 family glycosyltransferase
LQFSLLELQKIYDSEKHEVLVFIDGCSETEKLQNQFSWVKWFVSPINISASPARNFLYKKAIGDIFIGLDDDAHLISDNPVETIKRYFQSNKNLGILAFKEIKGIFINQESILYPTLKEEFLTTEFIGCGFAIRKSVYGKTNGFPLWIDIYGEESCVSMEVMNLDYDILFSNQIAVNHRVNVEERRLQGKNFFRFEKQLKNAFRIFVVYYPNPFVKILKLLWHNFKKYAVSDITYFKMYCKAVGDMMISFPKMLKHQKVMTAKTGHKLKTLKKIQY